MQTNANTKFFEGEKSKNGQNLKILDDGLSISKFSSFGGGYFSRNTFADGLLGSKKALLASAHSRKKLGQKRGKSVQNEEN